MNKNDHRNSIRNVSSTELTTVVNIATVQQLIIGLSYCITEEFPAVNCPQKPVNTETSYYSNYIFLTHVSAFELFMYVYSYCNALSARFSL